MMRWAVTLVLERDDRSWSLENVPTRATRALMTELAATYPERVAFGVFDSVDYLLSSLSGYIVFDGELACKLYILALVN